MVDESNTAVNLEYIKTLFMISGFVRCVVIRKFTQKPELFVFKFNIRSTNAHISSTK
jgi:hypothetical protein